MDPNSNDIKSGGRPTHHSIFELLKLPRFEAARDFPAAGLAVLTLIIGASGQAGRQFLRYERQAILEDGEWWRLISGHFVHLGWPHLLLNLAGCLLVWFLFRRDYRLGQWLLIVLLSILVMDAGFLELNASLEWYVGLSGLLHGLFAAGMLSWLRGGSWESWLMLLIFTAKITWEQTSGPLPFTTESAGGPVVVDAHLYGALGGAMAALAVIGHSKIRQAYNARFSP